MHTSSTEETLGRGGVNPVTLQGYWADGEEGPGAGCGALSSRWSRGGLGGGAALGCG